MTGLSAALADAAETVRTSLLSLPFGVDGVAIAHAFSLCGALAGRLHNFS
jgi:hypothetical protein